MRMCCINLLLTLTLTGLMLFSVCTDSEHGRNCAILIPNIGGVHLIIMLLVNRMVSDAYHVYTCPVMSGLIKM